MTDLPSSIESWRRTSQPGGQFGVVNACTVTYTHVVDGTRSLEWAAVGIIDNESAEGENCAGYFQGNAYAGGPTWGLCVDVRDCSGGTRYGPLVNEFSIGAVGPDPVSVRRGLHVCLNSAVAEPRPTEGGYGIKVDANDREGRRWKTGIESSNSSLRSFNAAGASEGVDPTHRAYGATGRFIVGFDLSEASFSNGVALRIGNGQSIALEGTDTVRLRCKDGMTQLLWGDKVLMQVDGDGNVWARGKFERLP